MSSKTRQLVNLAHEPDGIREEKGDARIRLLPLLPGRKKSHALLLGTKDPSRRLKENDLKGNTILFLFFSYKINCEFTRSNNKDDSGLFHL